MEPKPHVVLETERLLLRRLLPEDLDALYALYRDPEIRQYFPEGTLSYEDTKEELEWFLNGHPRHPELGLWATIHKPTQQFIGRCGLLPWTIDGEYQVEVAYLIDKAFWRQGLATEAAQGIVEYAFQVLQLPRLVCFMFPENVASQGVAQKIGMTLQGEIVDEFGLSLVYAMSNPWLSPPTAE